MVDNWPKGLVLTWTGGQGTKNPAAPPPVVLALPTEQIAKIPGGSETHRLPLPGGHEYNLP
jgi:hypothetical protein